MFLVVQALSHRETTLKTAPIVLKALSLQQVPQVARRAKLELRQMQAEAIVLLAKMELLQGQPSISKVVFLQPCALVCNGSHTISQTARRCKIRF